MTEMATCREAVAGIRRLRDLARVVGLPPTADAELGRLEAAVEAAADAVRVLAVEAIRARSEQDQSRLF